MITTAGGLGRIAIAAQVGGNHCEFFRKLRRHVVPADMSLRATVQQQYRGTAAPYPSMDGNTGRDFNILDRETFKHDIPK
jgi:hypothetical protein